MDQTNTGRARVIWHILDHGLKFFVGLCGIQARREAKREASGELAIQRAAAAPDNPCFGSLQDVQNNIRLLPNVPLTPRSAAATSPLVNRPLCQQ